MLCVVAPARWLARPPDSHRGPEGTSWRRSMAAPRAWRARWLLTAGLALLILCVRLLPPAQGQPNLPMPRQLPGPNQEPMNGSAKKNNDDYQPTGPDILPQDYPGGLYPGIPVTLPDVLNLAVLANLD